jgi:hypothetical protein
MSGTSMAGPIRVADRSGSSTPGKEKNGIARRNEMSAAEIWTMIRAWMVLVVFPYLKRIHKCQIFIVGNEDLPCFLRVSGSNLKEKRVNQDVQLASPVPLLFFLEQFLYRINATMATMTKIITSHFAISMENPAMPRAPST